jgi:hypothetical protein
MTTIEAEATRTTLREKLDAAKSAPEELDARRNDIALEAHAHGGDPKKELDRLNKSRATHVAEIETIEAAVIVSSRRV